MRWRRDGAQSADDEDQGPTSEDTRPTHIPVEQDWATGDGYDAEFSAFVAAHGSDLSKTAWFLCGDVHQAEELVQETLVRTFLKWRRAREGEPLAYARRILANLRIDRWRKRRRETITPPEYMPENYSQDEAEAIADRDRLVQALRELPPRRRKIVVLRHLVGLPEAEVADAVGVSLGTVKSTVSRSLTQLRRILGDEGFDGESGTSDHYSEES